MNKAIRGAITCSNDENSMREATVELLNTILEKNTLTTDDIHFANFSATKDLTACYPAKYARLDCGFQDVPMMCYQEMHVENSLEKCIRVMLFADVKSDKVQHVYLKGAEKLRPDLKER
ncbi:chorismate mutase [bacterium]|nr:chorismate mutase [bacterium]